MELETDVGKQGQQGRDLSAFLEEAAGGGKTREAEACSKQDNEYAPGSIEPRAWRVPLASAIPGSWDEPEGFL